VVHDVTATDAPPDDAPADETQPRRRRFPPPPTRRQFVLLMLALLYLAGSLGYLLGSRPTGRPGEGSVDAGFLYDMTTHHEQAVTMSNLELINGEERAVTVFAREILTLQAYEIGLMDNQLAHWDLPSSRSGTEPGENPRGRSMEWMGMPVPAGQMPGMATEEELARLREARGRAADALFVTLMQEHHRGGVHMAEYAAEHASSKFVRTLAERMARNQRIEIEELEQARSRAGLAADPTS
jgi:uncharacterized protein (DUF305 family)